VKKRNITVALPIKERVAIIPSAIVSHIGGSVFIPASSADELRTALKVGTFSWSCAIFSSP
jgi:hypothetical protein